MKWIASIALMMIAGTAVADVNLVSQDRYIRETGFEFGPGGATPYTHTDAAPGYGAFSATYTYASQISGVDSTFMFGDGTASGQPGSVTNPFPFTGRSYFSVVFTVPFEQNYALSGSLTGSSVNPMPTVSSYLALTGPGMNIDRRSYLEPGAFNYSGLIGPGTYTLTLDARVTEFEGPFVTPATWQFTFRAVPTPSVLCTMCGAGILAVRRRRH